MTRKAAALPDYRDRLDAIDVAGWSTEQLIDQNLREPR
jgi:hypothetical protein